MAPTLGEAGFLTPFPRQGPCAGLRSAPSSHITGKRRLGFLCLLPAHQPKPKPPWRLPNVEARSSGLTSYLCPWGMKQGSELSGWGGECSCHVPFPGTGVKLHEPLFVICPVHCVGLLEDPMKWHIWNCDLDHTSLTTVGILSRKFFQRIYTEDLYIDNSVYQKIPSSRLCKVEFSWQR